jgi:hypothetical protein
MLGLVGQIMKFWGRIPVLALVCGLFAAPSAMADEWLPHPANAQWQYDWRDSTYNPSGTVENVVVQQQQGPSFTLAWADSAEQPPPTNSSPSCSANSDIGTMSFQDSSEGLLNTNWNSCPPPPSMPILCPTPANCSNSLSSTLYDVIWGNRAPVLSEPLLQGTTWTATGGGSNEVTSTSQYLGMRIVKVPAFPNGVLAAMVRTNIALAGTPGDDYGSGVRTTWWVRGVGPVLVLFDHVDGSVTNAALLQTNLKPSANQPDPDYFPLQQGLSGRYRWTNSRYLRKPEIEKISVAAVVNRTARLTAQSVSGPIRTLGQYGFSLRLDGLRNIWGSVSAASLAKFPRLGHKRHFFTPLDLVTYGFNPVLLAYPQAGQSWNSGNARDLSVYGVTGKTKVIGVRRVHVPAGTFQALEVQSTLSQHGSRFGSGVRTMWFAPGRGLVKLVFKHRDGSTSLIQLIK